MLFGKRTASVLFYVTSGLLRYFYLQASKEVKKKKGWYLVWVNTFTHCRVKDFLKIGRVLPFPISSLQYLVELFPKFWRLIVNRTDSREVPFLSTEGKRQIPLNEQFLRKCPTADLKPEEILVSVNIPCSKKVRISFFQFPGFTWRHLVNSKK